MSEFDSDLAVSVYDPEDNLNFSQVRLFRETICPTARLNRVATSAAQSRNVTTIPATTS